MLQGSMYACNFLRDIFFVTKLLELKCFCMAARDAAIVMTYSKANISYCSISNRYNSIYDCVEEIMMHT